MPDMTVFTKSVRKDLSLAFKKFILDKTTYVYVITAANLRNSVAFNEQLSVLDSRIEHALSIDEALLTEMATSRTILKTSLINLSAEDKALAEEIIDILTTTLANEIQFANDLVKIFNASRAASLELLAIVKNSYDALQCFIKKNPYSSKAAAGAGADTSPSPSPTDLDIELPAKLVATEQQITTLNQHIATLTANNTSIKKQIADFGCDYETKISSLRDSYEEKTAKLNAGITAAAQQIAELKQRISQLVEINTLAKQRITALTAEIEESSQKNKSNEALLATLNTNKTALETEIKLINEQVAELSHRYTESVAKNTFAEQQIVELNLHIAALTAENTSTKEHMSSLKEANKARDQKIAELSNSVTLLIKSTQNEITAATPPAKSKTRSVLASLVTPPRPTAIDDTTHATSITHTLTRALATSQASGGMLSTWTTAAMATIRGAVSPTSDTDAEAPKP